MKQTLLITALFLFCLSCSSDDDGGGVQDNPLISGKWYYETGNGAEATGCHKQCNIEFTSDGRLLFEAFVGSEPPNCTNTENYTGTYTVSGNDLTIIFESETIHGKFYVSNDILIYMGEASFAHGTNISTYDKTP